MVRKRKLHLLICAICLLSTVIFLTFKHIQPGKLLKLKANATDKKPLIVLGILTIDGHSALRNAQRKSWLSSMRTLKEHLPFRIVYKFWFDLPTTESIAENKEHGDIEYLNVTNHGWAVSYGEKLYVWMKYIVTQYPEAMMGLRVDDDVFVCVPQAFHKLDNIKSKKLYYGKINKLGDIDEMFVVTGIELIKRIARREYCNSSHLKCDTKYQLIELGYGSTSLLSWLQIYNDVDLHSDNKHMISRGRTFKGNRNAVITNEFCGKFLVHHKSTPESMNKLHRFNTVELSTHSFKQREPY